MGYISLIKDERWNKLSNHNYTYQQTRKVSVNKEKLKSIAKEPDMMEYDYRVFLCLLSELNGWEYPENSKNITDPLNYKRIDKEAISEFLGIKKKEVKKSIETLMDCGLLEEGSSDTVTKGYRFTF